MIWTINEKTEEKLLRKKTAPFDFSKYAKKDIRELVHTMRREMRKANGIGLSANQIGLDISVFVAQPEQKFYAVFNPEIIKSGKERISLEEGCLSVPEVFGDVERPDQVVLAGQDQNGKRMKIKAWGILARVFQHEADHLNGIVFIDKAEGIHKYESS